MDERILEIAERARVQDRGYFIYQYGGPTGHQSVEKAIDLEKFAELIVRQMLDITDAHTEVFQTDRDKALIEHIKQSVKTHFGVKL